ncbi:endo-1,4-beta-xylanase [Micromonospora sp. BQ11]|uniref:endo-1,4-beta-xylanase n=1 Tax=Micromonospora sp. BQ11 TaxID=3452212 RepID=UPI003F887D8A
MTPTLPTPPCRQRASSRRRLSLVAVGAAALVALGGLPAVAAPPSAAPPGGPTLRDLADSRGLRIGAAVDADPVLAADVPYITTLTDQYNHATTANALKWDHLRPTRGSWNFREADAIVELALARGMTVQGHTLVWHHQRASWVNAISSEAEARAVLEEHIKTVVGRYRGRIKVWDVVNEATGDNGNRRSTSESVWERLIGPEYVELAFRWAHEADPDAVLQYNDYGSEEMSLKANAVYALVKDLRARGVPVHAVGWQLHAKYGWRITDAHWRNANRLAALGVQLSITEFDYGLPVPVTAGKLADQARAYREVAEFCVAQPACASLTTWGFTDEHSWIPGERPDHDAGLPFDRAYGAKPAFHALRDALGAVATTAPTAPRILDAVGADGRVTLGWRGVPGAERYTVRYGTSPTRLTGTVIVGRATGHTVTGLADHTAHHFSVTAGNALGDGPASATATATPTAARAGRPTLAVAATDTRALLLRWSRASHATGYSVEYGRVTDGGFPVRVDVGNLTRYRLTGLTDGTAYQVRVIAHNGNGDGRPSATRTATPALPSTPRLPSVQATGTVTVDGVLDEADWRLATPVSETVLGTTDNTARVGFTWDDTYLYVGVEVTDGTLRRDSHDPYEDDGVEIHLDGDDDRAQAYNPLTDRHFFKRWNDPGLTEARGDTAGVRHAWAPRPGGYAVELAVPWTSIQVRPGRDTTLGIDVAVNDDDDGYTREGQQVAFGTEANWQDLSAVAQLTHLARGSR